jgi:hypothetical protein
MNLNPQPRNPTNIPTAAPQTYFAIRNPISLPTVVSALRTPKSKNSIVDAIENERMQRMASMTPEAIKVDGIPLSTPKPRCYSEIRLGTVIEGLVHARAVPKQKHAFIGKPYSPYMINEAVQASTS